MMSLGSPSFFDSDILSASIWIYVQGPIEHISSNGVVMKITKRGPQRKALHLGLGISQLYRFNNQKEAIKCISLIDTRIEMLMDELGFKITRNQYYFTFFVQTREDWLSWREQLIKRCFQTNFHEEFSVSKMIGKGSFAKVYLATKRIKAFNKEFMSEQFKGKASLQNEISVMRKLDHPHIVTLWEVYETQNSIYFILDIIQGGELLQRVKSKGPLNQKELQALSYNLIRALVHMHSRNCMHRDLKPENILLKSKDNQIDVVIADFGLATFLDVDIIFKRCGTPGFVAPEILNYKEGGQFYDFKCDVFSAGIILYILLVGKQPFQGQDYKQILRANKSCEVNFDVPQIRNAAPELQDLLQNMLRADPTSRISSFDALKHPYFACLEADSKGPHQQEVIENIFQYDKDFTYGLSIKKSQDSQIGSMELQQRQPALTGKTDTVGSLSTYSNTSITKLEKPQRLVSQQLKISQFSQKYGGGSARTISIPKQLECASPTSRNKQDGLHKQAIRNSLYSKQRFDDQKQNEDQVVDEAPQLQQHMSALTYTSDLKFIRGGNNSLPGSPLYGGNKKDDL